MVSVRFSTVFTRSPNGVIALADIIGDETYRYFLSTADGGTVQNRKLTIYVYALQCNGNLLQKALRKQLVGAQIDPKCALVADVKTKFFCP